jgi:hypothetical protein
LNKHVNICRLSDSKASIKVGGGQERKSLGTIGGSGDQSARKWKSMFDVSGGKSGSSSVNAVSGPASPTKSSRAKTPTLSVFTGQLNTSTCGVSRRTSSPSAMHYGIMLTNLTVSVKSRGLSVFPAQLGIVVHWRYINVHKLSGVSLIFHFCVVDVAKRHLKVH